METYIDENFTHKFLEALDLDVNDIKFETTDECIRAIYERENLYFELGK